MKRSVAPFSGFFHPIIGAVEFRTLPDSTKDNVVNFLAVFLQIAALRHHNKVLFFPLKFRRCFACLVENNQLNVAIPNRP
jgi:hypothetical protein